ncbi:hypothetical protein Micbo1qcDRAFT_173780 [Microdochium bolleyi]|uniref:Uncharacterized protein n=1 Tax=Microdochium bolleyi TaxID=196109 RepID=A0A136J5Z0_9PEZI|nr:hypothetical protein Micbo1qcDRAFT_173780 [Microdochium bolleyi]
MPSKKVRNKLKKAAERQRALDNDRQQQASTSADPNRSAAAPYSADQIGDLVAAARISQMIRHAAEEAAAAGTNAETAARMPPSSQISAETDREMIDMVLRTADAAGVQLDHDDVDMSTVLQNRPGQPEPTGASNTDDANNSRAELRQAPELDASPQSPEDTGSGSQAACRNTFESSRVLSALAVSLGVDVSEMDLVLRQMMQ